ncbi:MAG: carbamoyltransferase [Deltaproteobacteria bacterium]|nr:carbamoyltransferase [Deltaproteobacteria bacterium]
MNVLGICDSQDSGAALFVNGRLAAAVNEERLTRVKLWGGFPAGSIEEVLALGGLGPEDLDVVVLGTRITPNILARAFRDIHQPLRRWNGQFRYLLNAFLTYQALAHKLRFPVAAEALAALAVIRRQVRAMGIKAKVVSVDHHLAHSYGAWATSPFDRALVVTVDGIGDGITTSVSVGDRRTGLKRVHAESGFAALTMYYSRLTAFLGFTAIKDEGKVTALAAYTDKTPLLDVARRVLSCTNGRFNFQNHLIPESTKRFPYTEMTRWSREEVAASFQKNLEDVMRDYVRYWMDRTGTSRLAVAGGVFANVKLNQRLAAMDEVEELYVFPHMGDGGLAVGGALAFLRARPRVLDNVFLGPGFQDFDIEGAISRSGLKYHRSEDVEAETAALLAKGLVVARFSGRMEYGPRAMGNRSILVQATDPDTIDWLNARLKRNRFMPFAPVLLDSEYDRCIINGDKARHASQFMTVSFDVTDRMRRLCPGAVHVDGTARPQRVTPEANPGLARILAEYGRLTGLPALINTSFNMHEEPIVCTPSEAVDAFRRSGLDRLAIGSFIAQSD